MKNPTRQQYMNNEVDFATFYSAVVSTAGINLTSSRLIDRVRKALAAGDQHLNTIPLPEWDALAEIYKSRLAAAFKEHGDFYSIGGGVCAMKQAIRNRVRATQGELP